ncbi:MULTISPECIES: MarR family transcriptional regulator [unclassified Fibrobacter]|jgi:DNA-binding MarR family transcriptional regulator|uniref:MarR family transcriptional regulator n=1 Tax=unclassified Fibrobacter TaxID=2634177 RepID=UPI0025BB0880|nr:MULTISPECIES: MarR family transcriptional regulator [unclassified Fibrobacter]MBQ1289777.1 MarR family transcriptional regulator [Lachnospiraceae bacterium]MBR3586403.1 MarR family transcriptional regulator [Oscillospiraceae bacterium]
MSRQGGFLISQIKQVGGRVFDRILSDKNIDAFNGAQGRILYILWQGDGVPISKLSKETGLAMNTLTSMLDRMEAAGLVRRDRGDHDRRKILIYLTDEAKALEQDYNAVTAEIESIYYKGFSSEEIDALEGYLRRVLTNVEEAL